MNQGGRFIWCKGKDKQSKSEQPDWEGSGSEARQGW